MGLSSVLLFLLFGCCWYSTSSANPTGKVEKFGGLNSYITGPPESKIAVIMASDVYGYTVPHLRMIADEAGARRFYALVPDFFRGDPYTNSTVEPVDQWKRRHPQDKGVEDAESIIEALKHKGITKIGAVGFCWGGKVAVDLTKAPYVKVGVLLHPTEVTLSDIREVQVPLSILGGGRDDQTKPSLILEFGHALKKAKPELDCFVKIYPECLHGWSNDANKTQVMYAEETHRDLLDWLAKHLITQNPNRGTSTGQVQEIGGLNFSFFLLLLWTLA